MSEDAATMACGAGVDTVQVKGNVVICSSPIAATAFHRRTFDFTNEKQAVTQALFTTFSGGPKAASQDNAPSSVPSLGPQSPLLLDLSPTQSSQDSRRRALVVVLKTLMHVIYPDGGSYIVHLPFSVYKVWSIPLGLLLDRHPESIQTSILSQSHPQFPRLFTLSSPLDDFGMVTSNPPMLVVDEEFLFVSSGEDGIFLSRNKTENRLTIWHASSDQQVRKKPFSRRRSSVGPSAFKSQDDHEFEPSALRISEGARPMERHNSRVSDVGFTMDRTSFADPDRLTVMTEPEGLKVELNLQVLEHIPYDSQWINPQVVLVPASTKLDVLCIHEQRSQILHLFNLTRRRSLGPPTVKDRCRISAICFSPVSVHRSTRLLILSPDLILRIHAPWQTRLNVVVPSTQSWKSFTSLHNNCFVLTDGKSPPQKHHLDLVPQDQLVHWCFDILECIFESNFASLFLSVYSAAKLKGKSTDLSAFVTTLFACFFAVNTRSPSPSPRPVSDRTSDNKTDFDLWRTASSFFHRQLVPTSRPEFTPTRFFQDAKDLAHHFEGIQRSSHLMVILLAFHALSEELRLHFALSDLNKSMVPILSQLAHWLARTSFVDYYTEAYPEIEDLEFDKRPFSGIRDLGLSLQQPWSIYKWLVTCVRAAGPRVHDDSLLTLDAILFKSSSDRVPNKDKVDRARRLLPTIDKLRNIYPILNIRDFRGAFVKALDENSITPSWLNSLPIGVSYPLRVALSACKRQPLSTWSQSIYELVDRKDLVELLKMHARGLDLSAGSKSAPKRPDDVSSVSEICQKIQAPESLSSGPTLAEDHDEITNLIFRNDRRMLEVAKLLEYSQPGVTFWLRPSPSITEHVIVSAQQATVQGLAIRALAMPIGKGLLTFNSRTPLPTEKFHVPGFSFVFRMKPQNIIVTVDKAFLADTITQWPLFHLGVSGALSISPDSKDIDTSWIVFNKPNEPTSRHAGFLLGLGLNGHLKKIARWHLLNYLTTKHVLTSVALLLGLGVSYLGSGDPKITKLLSVHVAAMLPPGAADLKINIWVQTAGIMALGLLYFDSCHRRTSEVLLSELTVSAKSVAFSYSSSIPPELQRDESYRLACGFALGFINLGKGPDLRSAAERSMVDKLCRITEGLSLSENAEKNMIVAIPGCVTALSLMYLRTNNKAIAQRLGVPETTALMEYVRPDLLFLRTVAKNLILWDSIEPTNKWIALQFPVQLLKDRKSTLAALDSDALDVLGILTGACYVMGLRYAGTCNIDAKNCLLYHLDRIMRVCSLKAMTYDENISRINLRAFQDALCLGLAAIMAGTGDLDVLRRLRRLHGRRHDDASYGGHMAAHMAIGLLFMSGGQYTLGSSRLATAALFCSTYPKFPATPADNNFHLQALRHLWILAAERRCFIPRLVENFQPTLVPIKVVLKSDTEKTGIDLIAPCLLPELARIASIETATSEFQKVVLDFVALPSLLGQFRRNPMIFVIRNPIVAAFQTPFEQGLARLLEKDSRAYKSGKSITASVQECLYTGYLGDDSGMTEEDVLESGYPSESSDLRLDFRCGVLHVISQGATADRLYDFKLALSNFEARERSGKLEGVDDPMTDDFAEKARFRLWSRAHA